MYQQPGTLTLSGNVANYGRIVKTGKWHLSREAEPKDYEISTDKVRNLKRSTYDRLAAESGAFEDSTTYGSMCDQLQTKGDYTEHPKASMVTAETVASVVLDRDIGRPSRGPGALFPRHSSKYDKHHLESTYNADYGDRVTDEQIKQKCESENKVERPDEDLLTAANKRPLSQFCDTAGHRRQGRNTWQDETGVYANTHLRRQAHAYKNPLTGEGHTFLSEYQK
ncbi:hypothetical protein BOX15_Mlig030114g1 [Macrostomum lignano]|uniref:TEX36 n=3 Tax=Macrostomum lignano TaxID=282301 RepID=A0A1I8H061_9PLAT|nr:hypothetical protein BOX15_Mlig030114g1 [Macrostomum lignano]